MGGLVRCADRTSAAASSASIKPFIAAPAWPCRGMERDHDRIAAALRRLPAYALHDPKGRRTGAWEPWPLGTAAKEIAHAPSTVHCIWRAFGLQPHHSQTFKLSSHLLFEKVPDIVGLYLLPPERAVVLSVDEKSQVQALDRTQPPLPMRPRGTRSCAHATTSDTEPPRSLPLST
jgi:hypothetical protein